MPKLDLSMVNVEDPIDLSTWNFGDFAELSDGLLVQFVGMSDQYREFCFKFTNSALGITRMFSVDGRNIHQPSLKILRKSSSYQAEPQPPRERTPTHLENPHVR